LLDSFNSGCSDWLSKGVARNIGSDGETLFWSQWWVGYSSLKELFPCLFILAKDKGVSVSDEGQCVNGIWSWL